MDADVPLAKACHMTKPSINVGGNYRSMEHVLQAQGLKLLIGGELGGANYQIS